MYYVSDNAAFERVWKIHKHSQTKPQPQCLYEVVIIIRVHYYIDFHDSRPRKAKEKNSNVGLSTNTLTSNRRSLTFSSCTQSLH